MKRIKEYMNGIVVVFALLLSTVSFAQNPITVTGIVTDENGEPLPGASVVIENTNTGALTDASGKYSIKVQSGKALVYSFIGYKPSTELVRNNKTINVSLDPDTRLLDEVGQQYLQDKFAEYVKNTAFFHTLGLKIPTIKYVSVSHWRTFALRTRYEVQGILV